MASASIIGIRFLSTLYLSALLPDCSAHLSWRQVQEVRDEAIGMLGLDAEGSEHVDREVAQVVRHDDVGPGPKRGGEHVSVALVRQRQALDQRLVPRDEAVPNILVHEVAAPLEQGSVQVGPAPVQRLDPLVVDLVRPAGSEEIGQGQPHQQVGEGHRVEHAGVEEGRERCHGSQ